MAGYDQQDAHEFLIALLDGLGSHLEKYHGEANTFFPRYSSPYEGVNNVNYSRSNSITEPPSSSSSISRVQSQVSLSIPVGINCSPRFSLDSPRFLNQGPRTPRVTPNKSGCFRGFVNEVRFDTLKKYFIIEKQFCIALVLCMRAN